MDSVVAHLRAHGWAAISIDPPLALRFARLVSHANWLFDQPRETKAHVDIRSSIGHRGWVPVDEVGNYGDEGPRRYEAFDIGCPSNGTTTAPSHPLQGPNVWIEGTKGTTMQTDAEKMFDELSMMALVMGDAICDDLHVPREELRQLRNAPVSQLRLIRYLDASPQASHQEPASAMGAHTDYEFFTFLFQTSPGAQILGREGEWIDAPHRGVLTVLVGDMLEVFSNGTYASVMHRAAAFVDPGRVSIPFFAGANFDAVVSPVVPGPRTGGVHFGEHLMSQLKRDFPYLRNSEQETTRDETAPPRSTFEERAELRLQNRGTQTL